MILDGARLHEVALAFLDAISQLPETPQAVGGMDMDAHSLVAAIIIKAHELGIQPQIGCIVRRTPKRWGTERLIENPQPAGTTIVVVAPERSKASAACRILESLDYRVVGVFLPDEGMFVRFCVKGRHVWVPVVQFQFLRELAVSAPHYMDEIVEAAIVLGNLTERLLPHVVNAAIATNYPLFEVAQSMIEAVKPTDLRATIMTEDDA